jgi:hypothetical protein
MLLENAEAPDAPDGFATGAVVTPHVSTLSSSIQDDVERLIDIAAQLFSAIERQIHRIEQDLNYSAGGRVGEKNGHVVFKEQLIRSAASLDASLQQIVEHLGQRHVQRSELATNPERSYSE